MQEDSSLQCHIPIEEKVDKPAAETGDRAIAYHRPRCSYLSAKGLTTLAK